MGLFGDKVSDKKLSDLVVPASSNSTPSWAMDSAPATAPAWATEATPSASPSWAAETPANPRMDKIRTYAAETDKLIGLTPGTSLAQLQQESAFRDGAISPTGARGLAQVIGQTRATLQKRLGRPLDPHNTDDALLIHREVMKENMKKFGNRDDALRAYNGGWDKSAWTRPETANYVSAVNSKMGGPIPSDAAVAAADGTRAGGGSGGYKGFGQVRQNVEPKSLNTDPTWLAASALMYELWERKPFKGKPEDLAEWGKDSLGNFNYNTVSMAQIANTVRQGTQEQKEAFLFMMDTYDNTNMSLEGAGRAAKGVFTDPLNLVGLSTFGIGFGANMAARMAAKKAAKEVVKMSMAQAFKEAVITGAGRTGIIAGMEGSIYGGAQSGIKQSVEVSAGRRDEISTGKVLEDAAIGAASGLVLGTGLDVVASKVLPPVARAAGKLKDKVMGKGKDIPEPRVEPTMDTVTPAEPSKTPTEVADKVVAPDSNSSSPIKLKDGSQATVEYSRITVTDNNGRVQPNIIFKIQDKDGVEIGGGGFFPHADGTSAKWEAHFFIEEGKRRNGVLTQVINDFEAKTGEKVGITPTASEDAKAFWKNRELKQDSPQPTESAAAPGRQQDGRLPADETRPDMAGVTEPIVNVPQVENTGQRTTRVNGEDVAKVTRANVEEAAAPIVQQLKDLHPDQLPQALEQLRSGAYHPEQRRVIDNALRLFNGDLKREAAEAIVERDKLLGKSNRTPEEETKLQQLTDTVEEKLDRLATPGLADDAAGSMAGTMLNDRRNGGAGTLAITVEDIMAEKGLGREEALKVWAEVVAKAEQDAVVQRVADGYEVKIQAAMEAGDTKLATELAVQKRREIAGMVDEIAPNSSGLINKAKELAISNVFSPTTVQINLVSSTIKTLITPALKFLFSNPFEKAVRAEAVASYSAMKASLGASLRAAAVAYRLEQALLTRDGTRLVEGELAIQGIKGGVIRFFPRILAASDEFLSRINYDTFVSGKAAAEAAVEGAGKGLKGDDLNAFIKAASEKALKESRPVANGDDLIQPIINKGVNLKLTGDALWEFVEKEAMRNPDALRKGTDEEALAYVRDVLYKRDFSGNNWASGLAQLYEKMNKKVPAWALVTGQLFFRTPIRVFEEGIRLTPGLQIIAPGFVSDLAGKNGTARQVRAQAESMTSLAVAGSVLALYSQGRITGDGAYSDFKQQRNRTDGPEAAPYTIKMSDGSTWSYKNFDPISTPMKIMVNALERADRLKLKQSQGEDIPDSVIEKAFSHVSVGVTAVLVAIKDANLVSGARMTAEIFTNAEDIEKNEDKFLKMLGDKMSLLVPNTLHKIAKDNDPGIRDPRDFWQMVDERLARSLHQEVKGVKTSMSYDILGNVRKMADEDSLWNIFSTSSVEERNKGLSEKELVVLAETDRLSRVMGATFKPPVKHESLGDLDLRTVMAKGGKRTLYDVWQQNYKELNPTPALYELVKSEIPEGTYKYKEGKATDIQNMIKAYQDAAFLKLRQDEGAVIENEINKVIMNRAKSGAGLFDSKRPY